MKLPTIVTPEVLGNPYFGMLDPRFNHSGLTRILISALKTLNSFKPVRKEEKFKNRE